VTPLLEPEVVETPVECTFSQTRHVTLDTLKNVFGYEKLAWEATRSCQCHFTEK